VSKFDKASQGYWKDNSNARQFLKSIASEMKISRPEDWYLVKQKGIFNLYIIE
jgi:hypothetical protein